MNTLLLDRDATDLCLDAIGNIAMASNPYSIVQDVASACRLLQNELWYGGAQGIPYFEEAFGKFRPTPLLKAKLVEAALGVPGVLTARAFLVSVKDTRTLGGQIQITTAAGPFTVSL